MRSKLPEALTLFQTKICDFPDAISDPTQTCSVLFRPDSVLKPGRPRWERGEVQREGLRLGFQDPAYAFPFLYHFEKKGIPFFIK